MTLIYIHKLADTVCNFEEPDERLSPETLTEVNVEKSLICLMGAWRSPVSVIEEQLILSLKTLTKTEGPTCCRLE